ncbi:ribosomal subunit interface protein [candidate division WOR-1 bacterium RIFOXYB2_FULL_42_35]|uniref:Ribosomal subunit interface protein n=1 Tax=candidate division WOR-1 bacterium RIFOXYC2_FULL_41_25 TaxID=1802586 RepID=A0A1F4TN20_UNCSA|nr:MAG: ribosomal subunit interface protein [candidate division WOR-1 bacterium RIFOXYA2_FULL_41_14]OGC24506.1 MAG: ribosomal subunit interface protein [candidate division WOR-1 bacterium RIFOXYB2_FULL_42_35]OGC34122.1 MAG: ribosomal subunit interface protein [candidate division WOR-1 bacterium RIFOXYC2_FULL_41_25]OGC42815.1 MAG: ribosomal subunit interface protein [candidate division WOR-1 bacterium RIFOXYD2_FULL_41_8]
MQITISARGTELTPALKEYVQQKVAKLEEFFNNIQKVEVVLEVRKINDKEHKQVAEIRAWLAGLKVVQALEAGKDLYAATDLVVDEVKRQIKRHKEKHLKKAKRETIRKKYQDLDGIQDESVDSPILAKVDAFARKPMSLGEAKDELKIMEQDFLAFRNSADDSICVLKKDKKTMKLLAKGKEMLPEEAVAELQKKKQNLIFFNNKQSQIPAVVYRRKSGDFGLIEP